MATQRDEKAGILAQTIHNLRPHPASGDEEKDR